MNETSKPFNVYHAECRVSDIQNRLKVIKASFQDIDRRLAFEEITISFIPSLLHDEQIFGTEYIPPHFEWEEEIVVLKEKIDEVNRLAELKKRFEEEYLKKCKEISDISDCMFNDDTCTIIKYFFDTISELDHRILSRLMDISDKLAEILSDMKDEIEAKINENVYRFDNKVTSRNINDYLIPNKPEFDCITNTLGTYIKNDES